MDVQKRTKLLKRMILKEAKVNDSKLFPKKDLFPKLEGPNKPPELKGTAKPKLIQDTTKMPKLEMTQQGRRPSFTSELKKTNPYNKN